MNCPDPVERAARGIIRATLQALGGRTPSVVHLVVKEDAALWLHVKAIAHAMGWHVTEASHASDEALPRVTRSEGPRVLWWQEAFRKEEPAGLVSWPEYWSEHFELLVSIGYPEGLTSRRLFELVAGAYDMALAVDPGRVERRSAAVSHLMSQASEVLLKHEESYIRIPRQHEARTDFDSVGRDAPILQLPLGESWLPVDSPRFTIQLPYLNDFDIRNAQIEDGRFEGINICEVGIGTNSACRPIPGTLLPEKTDGRVHLGLGDNILMGGDTSGSFHGDLFLTPEVSLVAKIDDSFEVCVSPAKTSPQAYVAVTGEGQRIVRVPLRGFVGPNDGDPCEIIEAFGERIGPSWSNWESLGSLVDPRSTELFVFPETDIERVCSLDNGASEGPYADLWQRFQITLGPLPWPRVDILRAPLSKLGLAQAVSVPGAILLDHSLKSRPLTEKWLYISHEMCHQWIGGMMRLGPKHSSTWEAACEGIAQRISEEVLGSRSAEVFRLLRTRQRVFSDGLSRITEEWATDVALCSVVRQICEESLLQARRQEDIPLPPRSRACSPVK